ncbi:MAG: hypothetical protein U0103_18810 [Candidatus Obscuribacterales bacterium]|nr:hypothetical protein [Cyanobacteria bacterium SZAS LIN-5]
MPSATSKSKLLHSGIAFLVAMTCSVGAFAQDGSRKTPEQFGALYMKTFNANDVEGLRKLRMPVKVQSSMQELIDGITEASMKDGNKFTKFEILPPKPDMDKANMGPDGLFYKANLKPTNLLKLSAEGKNSSISTTIPIGIKDGIYYEVGVEPAPDATPEYAFGWQRVSLPKSNWSVLMPNEAEPGKAALEKQFGKAAAENPDSYGVVKNTADIKTTQHWARCGEQGKRVNDPDNKESYRAACTTFEPETLKNWFNDPKKNIDDAVDLASRQNGGTVVKTADIDLKGAPGKSYEIKDKDGALRLGRVYWVKDALYELTFLSSKEAPDTASADKFLTSLEVN